MLHVSCCCQLLTDFYPVNRTQNNCSHISRWTLTGLKLSFTWFSINHVLVTNLIIRIFWGALLSLFLSGGMIFISHLLRSVYFFFSQSSLDCIIMFGSFQSHLKTYYWRYRVTTHFYIILCQYLLYWKISLIYKHQNFITFWHILYIPASEPNCIFLSLWIKLSCFSFIFSLYHTIWAIKTWWIKYDTEHKYICKLF